MRPSVVGWRRWSIGAAIDQGVNGVNGRQFERSHFVRPANKTVDGVTASGALTQDTFALPRGLGPAQAND